MTTGRLAALTRYPVKSLGGEPVSRADVTVRGLAHDRTWAVYTADGGIGSGKTTRRFRRVNGLLRWTATASGDVPVVTAPDGRRWRADSAELSAALSEACGRPLALRTETDVPHHDDAPVHVLTTASLRTLGARLGGPVDPRRFRANLLVDVDLEAGGDATDWPEDAWVGRTLTAGDVVLRLTAPMPRCVMVNAEQAEVPEDRRVLRSLADRGVHLGLMAEVLTPGRVRVGDRVVVD